MTWPKISVITPTYNQGQFIERTIHSVLDQGYPNLEFIVVDGGSTDNTVSVLKKFGKKIQWVSEPDHGQADAINKGLRRSTGKILAYLNSDDTYEPNALKTVALYFLKHPKTQFVYGRGKLIDLQDHKIGMYNDSVMTHETLFAACGISQPTAFWTRRVHKEIGEFDSSYHFTMDYDYWIRVSEKFPLQFLSNALVANTRIHADAKTSRSTHRLHAEALRTTLAHYGKVHYDWIFTYVDSGFTGKKGTPTYFRYMVLHSFPLFIKYNHAIPPRKGMKILLSWLRQALWE